MVINNLPCTTCVHEHLCKYKEKYVSNIVDNYPAVTPCDLHQECANCDCKDGSCIVIKY